MRPISSYVQLVIRKERLMSRAVIFVGGEKRFHERAEFLKRYLLQETGLWKRAVAVVPCWNKEPEEVLVDIQAHSMKAKRRPLLLAYMGHGYEDGWSYGYRTNTSPLRVGYEAIGASLRAHRGPLLVLNDCCHSGRIQDQMAWIGADEIPIGVLAACAASELSYGEMTGDVVASWRARKHYEPLVRQSPTTTSRVEARFGALLDHHFFPKPI